MRYHIIYKNIPVVYAPCLVPLLPCLRRSCGLPLQDLGALPKRKICVAGYTFLMGSGDLTFNSCDLGMKYGDLTTKDGDSIIKHGDEHRGRC